MSRKLNRDLLDALPVSQKRFEKLLEDFTYFELPGSSVVNTHQLRKRNGELTIYPKAGLSPVLLRIRWSKKGPVVAVSTGGGEEMVYLLPPVESAAPITGKSSGDLPPITFAALGDFVMIETKADAYEFRIVQRKYKDELPPDIQLLTSAARGDVRQTLEAAGPTSSMIAFAKGQLGDPDDSDYPYTPNQGRMLLAFVSSMESLAGNCVAGGPAIQDDK